ncbi:MULTISPECIES: putative quinol monooxygenase [unclassified Mesorhizobium]|uniref:putative quinol monooxygenase n=1 Tax=unclassified Mesorhizobium TaxID=325217 RepID=UPI0003CEE88F|nr:MULTISPECIES: putative quinol monooxygenase [unclassified Mesorhizobium]ESY52535.1 antibiotic biosynthesis monooxygenase [Mesorhizobium sp. LNJC374B00]ESY61560.1 antibiotic biosynthesis monooxygenase [Mesorhizobium sp. LNJC372A00]ESZ65688.1 antibiotic biosynthesis monooxygenase [Mesorhizobium sp. L103C131B0]ESZ66408.1 antibiotic biosynthesis monooxygenase [Mesorhizobium sp. L103C120A0]WJI46860.1 antibiotic biosynthesis monooxygenase [Mesorhizobium sp. C120A]
MLVIIGTIRLPAQRLDEARPAMRRMILGSRAEPGCIEYSYAQDVLDAGLIHVTEVWSDRAALDAHFRSPHIADWRASWASLGIGERNLMLYEAGEPKPI